MVKKHIHTLLQKGSKKIGTDLVYIAKGGGWLALAQGVASIAAFIITIVLARVFTKDEYGVYRFLLTLLPLFAVANLPSMVGAITRSVARGNFVSLPRILSIRIRYGFLGSLASLIGAGYYLFMGNTNLALSLSVVAVLTPLYEVLNTYVAYLRGQERFDRSATYTAITRVVVALGTILIAFLTSSPLLTAATFVTTAIIFQGIYAWRIHKENITSQEKLPLPDDTDDVILYGKRLSAINILATINNHIDKVLIWYTFGPITLASYAIARSIPEQGTRLLNLLPRLALPKFSRRDWSSPHEKYIFFKKLIPLSGGLALISSAYIIAVWILFPILFPTYPEAIIPAIFLSPLFITIPVSGILGEIFTSTKEARTMIILQLVDILGYVSIFILLTLLSTPPLFVGIYTIVTQRVLAVISRIMALKIYAK